MYEAPLELFFSFVYVLAEAILSLFALLPRFALPPLPKRLLFWKSTPTADPKKVKKSTAEMLSSSQEELKGEEDRARDVVREAKEVYEEIAKLQVAPRPLSRSGSNGRQATSKSSTETRSLNTGVRPIPTKSTANSAKGRAASVQPIFKRTAPSGRLDVPTASLPGRTTSTAPRIPPAAQLASRAVPKKATTPIPATPAPQAESFEKALSPPTPMLQVGDFLMEPMGGQDSPTPPPDAAASCLGALRHPPAASTPPLAQQPKELSLSLYPSLPTSPLDFGAFPTAGPVVPLPGFDAPLTTAHPNSLMDAEPDVFQPVASTSTATETNAASLLDASATTTMDHSPARREFEAHRLPVQPPATPVPPGAFAFPRSTLSAVTSLPTSDLLGESPAVEESSLVNPFLPPLTATETKPPKPKPAPTPRKARPPPAAPTRATPARKAKQNPHPPETSPDALAAADATEGSGKRRKVTERWEYVPVPFNEPVEQIGLPASTRKPRKKPVKVEDVDSKKGKRPEGTAAGAKGPTSENRLAKASDVFASQIILTSTSTAPTARPATVASKSSLPPASNSSAASRTIAATRPKAASVPPRSTIPKPKTLPVPATRSARTSPGVSASATSTAPVTARTSTLRPTRSQSALSSEGSAGKAKAGRSMLAGGPVRVPRTGAGVREVGGP